MKPWELKREHERNFSDSHFFDEDTLKFFGETLSSMYVYAKTAVINGKECYVLSSKQHGKRKYHYFSVESYEHIVP